MKSFLKDTWTVAKWAMVKVEAIILVRWARLEGRHQTARRALRACGRARKELLDSLVR